MSSYIENICLAGKENKCKYLEENNGLFECTKYYVFEKGGNCDGVLLTDMKPYENVKQIEEVGICAVLRFSFTTGLMIGLDCFGYSGRYCYHTRQEAIEALNEWDGKNDPPGEWIKYKGRGGDRLRVPDPIENYKDQYKTLP